MDIKILTNDFCLVHVLDSVIRLEYTECFREAGRLYLEVSEGEKELSVLCVGNRIIVDRLVYTVVATNVKNGVISVTGVGFFEELDHLFMTQPRISYAIPSAYALELASSLSVDGVVYSAYGISQNGPIIEVYDYGKSYASILKRLFSEYDLGYRIFCSEKKNEIEFHVLALVDKAYDADNRVILSDEREDYELVGYEDDIERYKNRIELVIWYPVTQTLQRRTFDRSGNEPERELCVPVDDVIATTEAELNLALSERAQEIFAERKRKHFYTVRPTRELGINLGDSCMIESVTLGRADGATFCERKVQISDTGRDELYVFEVLR